MLHSQEISVLRFDYKPDVAERMRSYGNQVPQGVKNEVRTLLEGMGIFCGADDILVTRDIIEIVVPLDPNHFDADTLDSISGGIAEQQPIFMDGTSVRAIAKTVQNALIERN